MVSSDEGFVDRFRYLEHLIRPGCRRLGILKLVGCQQQRASRESLGIAWLFGVNKEHELGSERVRPGAGRLIGEDQSSHRICVAGPARVQWSLNPGGPSYGCSVCKPISVPAPGPPPPLNTLLRRAAECNLLVAEHNSRRVPRARMERTFSERAWRAHRQ